MGLHAILAILKPGLSTNSADRSSWCRLTRSAEWYCAAQARSKLMTIEWKRAGAGTTESADDAIAQATAASPRVAVVGAGLAGLTAARTLMRAGVNVTLYEGSSRVGGRVHSVVDRLGSGLATELGGEFIDSQHTDLLALVREFGLQLIDTQAPSEDALVPSYYFDAKHYSEEQVISDFEPLAARVRADVGALSRDISASRHSPIDVQFDRMSIAQ